MNSIRRKLFVQIGSLVILLIGTLFLVNNLFLESFYTNSKKVDLIKTYDAVNLLETSDYNSDNITLNTLDQKNRFDVMIRNTEHDIVFSSNNKFDKLLPQIQKENPFGPKLIIEQKEELDYKSRLLWVRDEMNGMRAMVLEGKLDNGYTLIIHFPMASIQPNIDIVNQFLLIIGVIVFILSLGVAYVISRSFTQPILNMNTVTKQMINMNFDNKCEVNTNDEIGQLAESINELSCELSSTMDQLHEKNEQLEQKVQEKRVLAQKRKELLSNVSHELKTPLALIQGYAEGLPIMAKENPDNMLTYGEIILDESKKMNELIERILDVDQIESGHLIVNERTFDLDELVNQQLHTMKSLTDSKKIEINYRAKDSSVKGDVILIERVISNLLTNAIYHAKSSTVDIEITQTNGHARLSISNLSDQLNESDLENLWDSFYKIDQARTRHQGGHGLGLSIVKAIMEAHDMPYGVSLSNDIITFWIQLPNA